MFASSGLNLSERLSVAALFLIVEEEIILDTWCYPFLKENKFLCCVFKVHLSSDLALMSGIVPSFLSLQTKQSLQ